MNHGKGFVLTEFVNQGQSKKTGDETSQTLSDRLERVTRGNRNLLLDVMRNFIDALPRDIRQIGQAQADPCLPRLIELAHRIRGAASNVGAERLRDMAGQIEDDARNGQANPLCLQIEPEWAAVKAEAEKRGWYIAIKGG